MKKRWIALYVENDPGVLAKIAGLFSGKSYNLDSLTVGTTEDESVSRMTISLYGDDATFEQIKKQLNRCIEVIKVIDLSNVRIHMKEILYMKIKGLTENNKDEPFRIAKAFNLTVKDYNKSEILLESIHTAQKNDDIIYAVKSIFPSLEVVRGGSVAIESINTSTKNFSKTLPY
ncbi:MAG: acetolactate synthase small subunit [Lachnospiraceae bacterium]|nr:acetolactate synthase small subunit [Lachnospiraceae bacterium]